MAKEVKKDIKKQTEDVTTVEAAAVVTYPDGTKLVAQEKDGKLTEVADLTPKDDSHAKTKAYFDEVEKNETKRSRFKKFAKVLIGGTVLAAAAVGIAAYVKKRLAEGADDDENGEWYIPVSPEAAAVTTVSHRSKPTLIELDSDHPLQKFGIENYEDYGDHVAVLMNQQMKMEELPDILDDIKETIPGISEESDAWMLVEAVKNQEDSEEEDD